MDWDGLLFKAIAFLIAITVHGSAQAYMAYRMGDPTPKLQGRITFNPVAHMDFLGTFLILFFPFGWAKPVLFDRMNFRGNKRVGVILTKAAGPLANLVTALLFAIAWIVMLKLGFANAEGLNAEVWQDFGMQTVSAIVWLNLIFFLFNLVPIPPLDGYWVVREVLPRRMVFKLNTYEKFGPFILLLAIYFGGAEKVLLPIINVILSWINEIATRML
jgi:Zn-dependent protease